MWFWIFAFAHSILIPVIMIIIGSLWLKKPPKTINNTYGYRTPMSSKNMDTWRFAHNYCGKLWKHIGWVILAVSLVPMIAVLGKDIEVVGRTSLVISFVQCAIMVGTIIPVEVTLKKNFDSNGNRKI